jgi:hypothetical protein
VKSVAPALFVVCLVLSLPAAARAAGSTASEDVPVRGGIAALAEVIPISPPPDRARFIAEAIRVVYSWPQTGPYSNEAIRGRIAAFFANSSSADTTDDIPVPLNAAVWSQVLHRTISREQLVAAILADRSAAMLCYGLAGLDDETLEFLVDHPGLVSRLAERAPATFAAFGESIRIHGEYIVVPGGDGARRGWEAVVGEKVDRPERFVQQLFEGDRGRLAYLFDLLSHVDRSTTELVFASPNGDALKRLASLVRKAFPEWDVATAPFVRPPADLGAFVGRLRAASDDEAGVDLGTTAFWQRVFDEPPNGSGRADIAWLAETIVGRPSRERERRLDLFSFTLRVFGAASSDDEVIAAAHGFGAFPVLMLTLERMGIKAPSVYVAAAQHAEKLSSLDASRGAVALGSFQGALALLERMTRVRTLDTASAETLARQLFAVRIEDGRYDGGVATWLAMLIDRVRSATSATRTASVDDVILAGAAGPERGAAAPRFEWEGQRYRVDPGAAELQRLRRTRTRQQGVPFATVMDIRAIVRAITTSTPTLEALHDAARALEGAAMDIAAAEQPADDAAIKTLRETARTLGSIRRQADIGDARRAVVPLGPVADTLLSHALVSLAYACDLGDPEGTILIAGDPSRRHDYGYDVPGRDARTKAMWGVAAIETRRGPWHLVGSVLALDVAMAPLALRRISVDRVPEAPMINLMHRDGFAAAVAIMNGTALSDADRDRIAEFIDRGRQRVGALAEGREDVNAAARDVDLDGWRTRALIWTIAHDPSTTRSLFSLTELLVLGGGRAAAVNSWGTYGYRTAGCLCSRLAQPADWRRWWGLSQAGLPAILVADLPLNVALVLHNLHVPAVLARPVLAAAMQDFVDGINPTDGNDWLTLARAAQAVDRTRFEDYVALAAADGPLVADTDEK